jgi:uncharacterized membrane protein
MSKVEELLKEIESLKSELENVKSNKVDGRKDEVLRLLVKGKIDIESMSNIIGISSRNISSQLSYLRKDMKDGKVKIDGKKVIGIGKNSLNKLYLEFEEI